VTSPSITAQPRAPSRAVAANTARSASARLPVRDGLLDYARAGDAIVVWKLDRLGRSLRDLIDVVTRLGQRGVGRDLFERRGGPIRIDKPQIIMQVRLFAAEGEHTLQKLLGRIELVELDAGISQGPANGPIGRIAFVNHPVATLSIGPLIEPEMQIAQR